MSSLTQSSSSENSTNNERVWAPLDIPLKRRVQTAAVFLTFSMMGGSFALLVIALFFPPMWLVLALYFAWMVYDWKTPSSGGRSSALVSRWRAFTAPFFKHFAEYFPSSIEGTTPLDPDGVYCFAISPHGFVGCSVWANILSEGSNAAQAARTKADDDHEQDHLLQHPLRDIDFRAVTLKSNFFLPFWRDFISLQGLCDCSKESFMACFNQKKSVVVVPGGAREALYAKPSEEIKLVLARRKGFVRLSIQHGVSLVPIFSFGENDVYDQYDNSPGTFVRKIQDWILATFGVALPMVKGRGIFNYAVGLLPHRKPLNMVIGRPIPTEKIENPTQQQIDEVHKQYCDELVRLFEENKKRFGYDQSTLKFI